MVSVLRSLPRCLREGRDVQEILVLEPLFSGEERAPAVLFFSFAPVIEQDAAVEGHSLKPGLFCDQDQDSASAQGA